MGGPVFISHSSKDRKIAATLCTALEARGIGCWMSSRDIGAGENFQEAIYRAISGAPGMVLVFSAHANNSAEITKELALASEHRVPVIPVRSEDVIPTGAYAYELSTRQWIDLFEDWERGIERLADQVRRVCLGAEGAAPAPSPAPAPKRRRVSPALLAGAAVVLLALVAGGLVVSGVVPWPPGAPTAPTGPGGPSAGGPPGQVAAPAVALRSTPTPIDGTQLEAMLVRLDLFDKQRNPSGKGVAHRYRQQAFGDDVVVIDDATGLMWQKSGSRDDQNTWKELPAYIEALNRRGYAGFSDWRVPTLEEAMSLMERERRGEIHLAPVFTRGFFIWTADPAPEERGWVVYFYDGYVTRESPNFNAYVRAVRAAGST